jgi:hypothetical protein
MDTPEVVFRTLANQLVLDNAGVAMGMMMSSPAVCYRGKVFAFYYDQQMVFKLGESFAPEKHGIRDYSLLSPFKTKSPMRAWFQISFKERQHWETLAKQALAYLRAELA